MSGLRAAGPRKRNLKLDGTMPQGALRRERERARRERHVGPTFANLFANLAPASFPRCLWSPPSNETRSVYGWPPVAPAGIPPPREGAARLAVCPRCLGQPPTRGRPATRVCGANAHAHATSDRVAGERRGAKTACREGTTVTETDERRRIPAAGAGSKTSASASARHPRRTRRPKRNLLALGKAAFPRGDGPRGGPSPRPEGGQETKRPHFQRDRENPSPPRIRTTSRSKANTTPD